MAKWLSGVFAVCLASREDENIGLLQVATQQRDSDDPNFLQLPKDRPPMCEETSVNMPFKQLALIHNPRTGGTTMEECAIDAPHDLRWGRRQARLNTTGLPMLKTNGPADFCSRWHTPPNLLPYYKDKETFCVVRNPYDRLLSQYGYMCKYGFDFDDLDGEWKWNPIDKCGNSTERMNALLYKVLQKVKSNPYNFDCHFLPQAAYVWGWDPEKKIVDEGKKHCDNMLRFEPSLPDAFNQLMKEHGYAYHMTDHAAGTKTDDSLNVLQPQHLSAEVIQLYNDLLDVDFRLLGYDILLMASSVF